MGLHSPFVHIAMMTTWRSFITSFDATTHIPHAISFWINLPGSIRWSLCCTPKASRCSLPLDCNQQRSRPLPNFRYWQLCWCLLPISCDRPNGSLESIPGCMTLNWWHKLGNTGKLDNLQTNVEYLPSLSNQAPPTPQHLFPPSVINFICHWLAPFLSWGTTSHHTRPIWSYHGFATRHHQSIPAPPIQGATST